MNNYKLEHVGITVTNLNKSVKWYETNFGFEETRRFSKYKFNILGAIMKLGDSYLEILQPYSPKQDTQKKETLVTLLHKKGANHLALNVDDIISSYNTLKKDNVKLVTKLLDSKFFFCRDPDGILIEVRQRK